MSVGLSSPKAATSHDKEWSQSPKGGRSGRTPRLVPSSAMSATGRAAAAASGQGERQRERRAIEPKGRDVARQGMVAIAEGRTQRPHTTSRAAPTSILSALSRRSHPLPDAPQMAPRPSVPAPDHSRPLLHSLSRQPANRPYAGAVQHVAHMMAQKAHTRVRSIVLRRTCPCCDLHLAVLTRRRLPPWSARTRRPRPHPGGPPAPCLTQRLHTPQAGRQPARGTHSAAKEAA